MSEEEHDETTYAERRVNPELMKYAGKYLSSRQTFTVWHLLMAALIIAVMPPAIGFSVVTVGTAIGIYLKSDKQLTVETEVKVKEDGG